MKSVSERCFADTSIISEELRDLLKHVSNKVFFTLIGIVTIFYTITFVLALHRQNPRIRALKKSLNVLNKFDSYPSTKSNQRTTDSIVSIQPQSTTPVTTTIANLSSKQKKILLNEFTLSDDNLSPTRKLIKPFDKDEQKPYEMSNLMHQDDVEDQNHSSPMLTRKGIQHETNAEPELRTSTSDGLSDEIVSALPEKAPSLKQVSFRIENHTNQINKEPNQHLSMTSNYFGSESDVNNDMYYKLPCPCSTTRQLLIKFHFSRPTSELKSWLCCCCIKTTSKTYRASVESPNQEELTKALTTTVQENRVSSTHSDTLRRQLHQHRLKQIRMASTFLIITVSFVLFYLPSILNAERIIKSPIMIYYLYLCTHALNPIIYCFMNPSLRAYVLSMFNCRKKQNKRHIRTGKSTVLERL